MVETYYDRLGVAEDATAAEIQRAYRERLKETHPDVSDDEDASDRTKRLIEAKEVLTDEDERARYDRLGHDQYVSTSGSDAGAAAGSTRETTGAATDAASAESSSATASGRTAWEGTTTTSSSGDDQRAPRDSWRDSEREKRRKRQHRSASEGTSGGNTAWRAWDTDGAYSVGGDGGYSGASVTDSESLVLLCATFIFYPLMLAGALYPGFPLVVNATLACCVLVVVAYLQSMPTVGVVVFGTWSVLVPAVFASLGIGLVTVVGLAAVCGTVLPLGLSALTRTVIQP